MAAVESPEQMAADNRKQVVAESPNQRVADNWARMVACAGVPQFGQKPPSNSVPQF